MLASEAPQNYYHSCRNEAVYHWGFATAGPSQDLPAYPDASSFRDIQIPENHILRVL